MSGFFVAHDGRKGHGDTAPAVAPSLPCLSSNNCTKGGPLINRLTGGHKRVAHALTGEVIGLASEFGIEKVGFLTLTFRDHVTDIKEAQRRFHSLNVHVLKERYSRTIATVERQESGRLHFHLVVVLASDIRSGCDFKAIAEGDYRSANSALRSEWAFWRKTAGLYGFGRTELLPVKSTAEAIGRYVGKYISKHIGKREERDRGARMVRYSGYAPGQRKFTCRFSWAGGNSWLWRRKLGAYCERIGIHDTDLLSRIYGPRWAYLLQHEILAVRIDEVAPDRASAVRASALSVARDASNDKAKRILECLTVTKTYQLKPPTGSISTPSG